MKTALKPITARLSSPARRHRQRGATIVEAALTLPILLFLMFGIVEFGRLVYSYNWTAHAAREASRYACVRGTTIDQATIKNTIVIPKAIAINTDADHLTVLLDPSDRKPGSPLTVTIQYKFDFIVPLGQIATLFGGSSTLSNSVTIVSASKMRIAH